jgi:hypothetical protein
LAGRQKVDIQVNRQKCQHKAVRTVADRQKKQTFRQEGKQLGVLAAARQQEDRLQETGYWKTGCWKTGYRKTRCRKTGFRKTGYRKTGDRETKSS